MILKNYYEYAKYCYQNPYTDPGAISTIKDFSNTNLQGIYYGTGGTLYTNPSFKNRDIKCDVNIIFGIGTTEPNFEDYSLTNDITASFTQTSFTRTYQTVYENNVNKIRTTFTYIGTNNTASPITITEIGIYKPVSGSSYSIVQNILFCKQLLSTPITVAAGDMLTMILYWDEE